MKSIFTGLLVCGKLSIPIKLYSAVESHSLGFRVLHAVCKTPLEYHRYCPKCKKEVDWEHVVKGLELPDGSFYIMTQEKFEKMKPETSDEIRIVEFADAETIVPIYYDAHYYCAPHTITQAPYFLLKEAMEKLGKVAIARFVMREKEYVSCISPYQTGFLLSTLNYAYEINPISAIKELSVEVKTKVTKREEQLAQTLIKKMSTKKFDISKFKDTFAQQLQEQVKRMLAGKKLLKKKGAEAVIKKAPKNITALLEESIQSLESKRARTRK